MAEAAQDLRQVFHDLAIVAMSSGVDQAYDGCGSGDLRDCADISGCGVGRT